MTGLIISDEQWAEQIRLRLKVIAATTGGGSALAKATGVPPSSVYSYLKDQEMTLSRAARFAEAGNVSLEWLAYGEDSKASNPYVARENVRTYGTGELVYVKMYSALAGAKPGGVFNAGADVIDTRAFRADWVRNRLRAKAEDLAMLIAFGDSMSPLICDGDSLLIDLRVATPSADDVYVLRLGDTLIVKRVQLGFGGALRLLSENPAYPIQEISATQAASDDFQCIGRVAWWAHTNA